MSCPGLHCEEEYGDTDSIRSWKLYIQNHCIDFSRDIWANTVIRCECILTEWGSQEVVLLHNSDNKSGRYTRHIDLSEERFLHIISILPKETEFHFFSYRLDNPGYTKCMCLHPTECHKYFE